MQCSLRCANRRVSGAWCVAYALPLQAQCCGCCLARFQLGWRGSHGVQIGGTLTKLHACLRRRTRACSRKCWTTAFYTAGRCYRGGSEGRLTRPLQRSNSCNQWPRWVATLYISARWQHAASSASAVTTLPDISAVLVGGGSDKVVCTADISPLLQFGRFWKHVIHPETTVSAPPA